jgi:TPR repeat protein
MAHIQARAMKQATSPSRAMPMLLAVVFFLSHATETHPMDKDMPTSSAQIYALDDAQRIDLARKAEAGDAEAAFRLSQHYTFTHSDADQRTHWLSVAAKAGHVVAQSNLASDLSTDGKDLAQAAQWAAEARRNGSPDADRLLGAIEAAQSAMLTPEEQTTLAAKAEAGDAEAAFRLSRYRNFVHQDRTQTRRWRKLAAEGGHAPAQYELAVDLYMNGKDLEQAARWAAEARKNGDADAGRLLREIEALQSASLTPDEEAALVAKAEAGDAEAAFRLSKYHHFVHQDGRVRGRRWLVRAAEGGQATAQYNLAVVLQMDGIFLAEAARWAAEARKNGDADAGRLLQRIEAVRSGARR